MADTAQVKEVVMDVGSSIDRGDDLQVGGVLTRRRRRGVGGGRRRRHTQKGGNAETIDAAVAVDKVDGPAPAPAPAPQVGGVAAAAVSKKQPAVVVPLAPVPKIVIAPPKKKQAKVMLVPKTKTPPVVTRPQKTFKAKRVSVTIDNTARTQKKRRMTLSRVDAMTEEQLRETAVATKLSRIETVKNVPVDLLRQMLKDYYTMRGMFL